MTRIMTMAFGAVFILAQAALAQSDVPKPTPEHMKLDQFVGVWQTEGEAMESPFGPAGKFTMKEDTDWFSGGFFLVSHSEMKGLMGAAKGLATMGYDAARKVYTYHAVNSMGMEESATGTVAGDTWTWTNESMLEGKSVKGRYIINVTSPTAMSFKFEMSMEGGPWKTVMEGTSTKLESKTSAK